MNLLCLGLANNLKEVDVRFPLGLMNVVTGVRDLKILTVGGCSSAHWKKMLDKRVEVGKHQEIKGYEKLEQLMVIDQEPIGRTPVPILHLYQGPGPDPDLFGKMNEARRRVLPSGDFHSMPVKAVAVPAKDRLSSDRNAFSFRCLGHL